MAQGGWRVGTRAFAVLLLASCGTRGAKPGADAGSEPPDADAAIPGDGDGDGDGDGQDETGKDAGAPDGGPPEPAFDASALNVEGSAGPGLCVLDEDGRKLLVTVKNAGDSVTYAATVRLASEGTEHELRLRTPTLGPGESAVLSFDRGPVAGYVEHWRFTLTVDPDGLHGTPHPALAGECQDLRSRATAGMAPLSAYYNTEKGLWNPLDWWTSANQLETVIDYTRETGDTTYFSQIDNSFEKNRANDFDQWGYYDDDGWWAMVWIKAYDLTRQQKYLDMAKTIFARMTIGWTDQCGGGIYWAGPRAGENGNRNKNAIPNSLFLQIAAKLHQRTPGDGGAGSYLDWAQREWAWFEGTGMIDDRNLVVDGLNNLTECRAAGPVFTYNTGVLVGGLVDLAAATGDDTLLDRATDVARATMTLMSEQGVLKETPCGGDICVQFKGVFMRNLAHLYRARPLAEFARYMRRQSDQLFDHNRNEQGQYGYEWHLPFDTSTAGRQSSALDALVAAVSSSNLNLALTGTASGSTACSANEEPNRAIDGNAATTKWCAGGPGEKSLTLDLGGERTVVGFRVRHAGAGGESPAWNTRAFSLATSLDRQNWTSAVNVTNNTDSVTTHPIPSVRARYVRLNVTEPQTAPDFAAARIYELEAFGIGLD